jgi:hypothetical protein
MLIKYDLRKMREEVTLSVLRHSYEESGDTQENLSGFIIISRPRFNVIGVLTTIPRSFVSPGKTDLR